MRSFPSVRWLTPVAMSLLLILVAVLSVSANPNRQETLVVADDSAERAPTAAPVQFPRYHIYTPPPTLGQDAGEPSLGVNHITNATMYVAILETLRIHFDDDYSADLIADPDIDHRICSAPVQEVWVDKSYAAHVNTLDPILFTDPLTGRTFSSQLGPKTSILGLSDDDGDSWLPSEGAAALASGVDHQTIASGPYPPEFPIQGTTYSNAVYYCGQDIAYANCARSDDGGVTFGAAIPMYTLVQCNGLHGHIQVEPIYEKDGVSVGGAIYTPIRNCGGGLGVAYSHDAGTTWAVSMIPGANASTKDPSVAIGANGTVYVGYADADTEMMVAVSYDRGVTYQNITDIATDFPDLQTVTFPSAIAGDDDRVAITFFGSDMANATQFNDTAIWYLYVSHTFDGGATWNTINLTPDDPVQRGSICTVSSNCNGDRNLLDFYDVKVDREGRVIIGYDDGCIGACVNDFPNSFTAVAAIARQEGGLGLYSAFDTQAMIDNMATAPASPRVDSVEQDAVGNVTLTWTLADDGGSDVLGYNVYRKEGLAGTFTKLNDSGLITESSYVDQTALLETDYFYRVTAENVVGEGVECLDFPIGGGVPQSPCNVPGIQVIVDAAGDNTTMVRGDTDIVAIAIAEPYDEADPTENFVVTLQMANLTAPTINNEYFVLFNFDGKDYYLGATLLDGLGGGTFEYGTFVYTVDNDNFFTETSLGTVDATYDSSGSIVFTIAKDKLNVTGNIPEAGSVLQSINARTYTSQGVTAFEDRVTPGSYNVVSNASCNVIPNAVPTARLVVTPTEGQTPLDVLIDASDSFDTDVSDSIVQYTFNLGDDGEPVVQSSPTLMYTYSHTDSVKREYGISVTVEDSRGATSMNPAKVTIEVRPEEVPTALSTSGIGIVSNRTGVWVGVALVAVLLLTVVGTTRRLSQKRNG